MSRGIGAAEPALVVRDANVLNEFPLERVLRQVIDSTGASQSPGDLLRRLFDTENTKAGGEFGEVLHCDDVQEASLPGAAECPRAEGRLARSEGLFEPGHADYFEPIALFNRFDLTPNDGSTCGEYRILYAKHSGRTDPTDRLFISVEASLFNETETLAACRPVAELWAGLALRTVDEQRAELVRFFYRGIGDLPPVLTAAHLGAGGSRCEYVGRCGQVRLGQGMQEPFTFRQFRAVATVTLEQTTLRFEPTTATRALRPNLFDLSPDDTAAVSFRNSFRFGVDELAVTELNRFDLPSSLGHEARESAVSGPSSPRFAAHISAGSAAQQADFFATFTPFLEKANLSCPEGDPITPLDVVNRATVIGCAGCHAPSQLLPPGRELGCGAVWPESLGVSHVDEQGELSPALREVFLPYRERVLTTFLQACDREAIKQNLHVVPSQVHAECFPAGTEITLSDGSRKAIERVQPGEWVMSFDLRARALVPAVVERVVLRQDAERFVRIDEGLVATDNHPFFQDGRWVRALDLEPGKKLLSLAASGHILQNARIEKLTLETGPRVTYNLRVSGHGYFAGGKLVHDQP